MNQSSTVELILRVAKAVNPMRQVQKEAKKTEAAIRKNKNAFEALSASAEKIQKSIEKSQGSFATGSRIQATFSARVLNTEKAMRAQIRALRQVQSTVKFNGALYKKAGDEIAKYEAILSSANRTTEKAKTSNGGLAAGLGKLAVAFGAARVAQGTLQAGIRRDESERRLRLLTQRFGETAEAQAAAQRAADKFNLSQTEANVQLSRLIARLRPMGLSMATIETAFAGFNTATILAGATASESAGAFLQLSQALGSGVLRGQELNSILEQAPLIAQAISTEMGVTVGALKKLGEEGEITSEIVIAALGRVEREGADQLTDALKGPAAAIKDFQNAVEDVQVALSGAIVPEMATSFRELATLIESLEGPIKFIGGLISAALSELNVLITQATNLPAAAARINIAAGKDPFDLGRALTFRNPRQGVEDLFGPERVKEIIDLAGIAARFGGRDKREVTIELFQKELGMFAAPASPDTKSKPKPRPTALSDEEKKRLERMKAQNIEAKTRFFRSQEELAILLETNNIEKIRLDFAAQRAQVQRDFVSLISEAKSEEERRNLLAALRNDLQRLSLEQNVAITGEIEKQTKTFSDQLAHQDELNQLLVQQHDIFAQIGQTIEDGLVRGIEDAITGAKSLGEALSGVLKSVGSMFLRQGIGSIVGNIFGGFGGGGFGVTPKTAGLDFSSAFASGGFVDQPTRAVIGEGGESEYVIPSSKMNEAMGRYARGARGGAVIPDGPGGDASGGMTGGGGSIDVSYSVERINNVNYVTAAEFERGMAQAAKRGAELGRRNVYSDLVNKRSVRSRVGV